MGQHITLCPLMCIILLTSAICSCKTKYVPVETKVTETVEVHDTTVQERLIPYRDSVAVRGTSSFLSNPYAYSWATWENGILHHSLAIWPSAIMVIKVPQYRTITKTIQIPKIVTVEIEKKLSQWQQVKQELGGYAISIVLIIIAWLIIKFRHKIGFKV